MSLAPASTPDTRLLVAEARAENTGTLLRVVDESLERAAELREEREARRALERAEEARRQRAEEAERLERADAERLAARHRVEAEAIAEERIRRRAEMERLLVERAVRVDVAG